MGILNIEKCSKNAEYILKKQRKQKRTEKPYNKEKSENKSRTILCPAFIFGGEDGV